MVGLADLPLRTSYHKGRDNIADDFYMPAMRCATEYDRAVGFFRSAAFIISWPALRDFVSGSGRIRILCSQVLSADDIEALEAGYAARVDDRIAARLRDEVATLLADASMREPARILAALVAAGIIEFKIAILKPAAGTATRRIFHDKLGLFRDRDGNVVMFKGSMNETWSGLAADGNLESVDVACSWLGGRDLERTTDEQAYFADLWANQYPGLDVRPFPDTARADLVAAAEADWEGALEHLLTTARPVAADAQGRTLLPHQATGLAAWRANDRRGILQFATGAGKTFTALEAIREAIATHHEVPVVIVPDTTLFDQWLAELAAATADLGARILRVGAGNARWRGILGTWTALGTTPRLVLATVQTARSPAFREEISGGRHLLLVADEVHRLGSASNRALLDEGLFGARLGLSATPERAGDPTGTAAILDFFGGILEPRYGLAEAIRDKVLTPYFYRPHTVALSDTESAEWRSLSRRIARARARVGDLAPGERFPQIDMLLFARARIVKQAVAKVTLAVEVLQMEYRAAQRWIIYCDDQDQLRAVIDALQEVGLTGMPFHSAMDGDRAETLRWFGNLGGIVVAIKCLDEGVDIPSVTHALILASSKNPREFVQRRGRVLRRAPDKSLAYVHDAIVVPPRRDDDEDAGPDPITAGELARAIEFAQGADNPASVTDLEQVAIDAGINWRTLTDAGVEDDD